MNQAHARVLTLNPWIDAARLAVVDLARQALGAVAQVAPTATLVDGLAGALIPIVSDLEPVQIGLFSSAAGCEALARALLGSAPGDPVTRADVVDAIGEIVNMLSGNIKARVARYANHAALGLPTFVHGPIETQSQQVVEGLRVTIGAADAYIVVLHSR